MFNEQQAALQLPGMSIHPKHCLGRLHNLQTVCLPHSLCFSFSYSTVFNFAHTFLQHQDLSFPFVWFHP